jgi:peroxiredoxin
MGLKDDAMRTAQLGTDRIHLLGQVPRRGERLTAEFAIPAARLADKPLTADELRSGLVVVSTLPNIEKHACLAQIVDLEERGRERLPGWKIVHVSADHEEHWQEVDRFHPNIQAAGYSLCCADPNSREAFVLAFGVGVEDHHRIAHGLFALRDGVFLVVEIPHDQMRPAEVKGFLQRLSEERGAPSSQAHRTISEE